jgi:hypothetical protein
MTGDSFEAMDEAEQRDLARRLWEGSKVLDFDTALEIVRRRPDEARELLQMRTEMEKREEERVRGRERRKRALIEDYG